MNSRDHSFAKLLISLKGFLMKEALPSKFVLSELDRFLNRFKILLLNIGKDKIFEVYLVLEACKQRILAANK